MHRVQADIPFSSDWETAPLSSQEEKEVGQILDQPFYFLDAGFQSYVFLSKDKTTVLKLFKHHHLKPLPWLAALPLPVQLSSYRDKFLQKRQLRFSRTFTSFKIAYDILKDETGLIYVHLNPTDQWKKKVTIVDKIGIAYTLDLDTTQFMLQKRVDRVYTKIDALMEHGEEEKAKKCISAIITLLEEQSKKGVMNKDPSIRRNIGFIGQKAIVLDTGSLLLNDAVRSYVYIKPKIVKTCLPFKAWLETCYPTLAAHLEKEIDNISYTNPRE